jgi:hypothetical protein
VRLDALGLLFTWLAGQLLKGVLRISTISNFLEAKKMKDAYNLKTSATLKVHTGKQLKNVHLISGNFLARKGN